MVRLGLRRLEKSQPAVAVDTKKRYEEIGVGTLDPGEHTWEAPYRSGWAVAIGRFSEDVATAGR